MSSTAQIEANRQNAQKSTGPVTPEGKAASSQNRFSNGFRGVFRVLPQESQEFFNLLLDTLRAEHQPTTITEEILIQRMAQHHWLSERARGTIQLAIETSDIPFNEMMPEVQLWMRYQTSNERAFHKCMTDLLKLKAERRKARLEEAALSQRAEDSRNGFERQKREEAEQPAKQEAQAAKTKLINAKAEALQLDTAMKSMIQAPLPGHATFDFNDLKAAITVAITQLCESRAALAN